MRKSEPIVPIILAAGGSATLPLPKALARFGRKTALQIALANCKAAGRPIVVLGADAKLIRRRIPNSIHVVVNREWRKGQLSSLQAALKKIPRNAAFMIYPVDHPLIGPATIREIVLAFRRRRAGHEIVMPRHKKRYGHPVLVSAAVREEFFSASTAREVIYRDRERLGTLRVDTASIFEDFNSAESYERCLRKFRHKRARSAS